MATQWKQGVGDFVRGLAFWILSYSGPHPMNVCTCFFQNHNKQQTLQAHQKPWWRRLQSTGTWKGWVNWLLLGEARGLECTVWQPIWFTVCCSNSSRFLVACFTLRTFTLPLSLLSFTIQEPWENVCHNDTNKYNTVVNFFGIFWHLWTTFLTITFQVKWDNRKPLKKVYKNLPTGAERETPACYACATGSDDRK